MSEFLRTTDHRFSLKKGLSAVPFVLGLKEIINHYRDLSSCVFTCFLDIKFGFDRVGYNKLFSKLVDRRIQFYLVVANFYIWQQLYV